MFIVFVSFLHVAPFLINKYSSLSYLVLITTHFLEMVHLNRISFQHHRTQICSCLWLLHILSVLWGPYVGYSSGLYNELRLDGSFASPAAPHCPAPVLCAPEDRSHLNLFQTAAALLVYLRSDHGPPEHILSRFLSQAIRCPQLPGRPDSSEAF